MLKMPVMSFCLLWGPLSSYWVALSSLKIKGGALSHCNLMCCVWLISLGGLPFSEGNQGRSGGGGILRRGGKRNCDQNIRCERINFKSKNICLEASNQHYGLLLLCWGIGCSALSFRMLNIYIFPPLGQAALCLMALFLFKYNPMKIYWINM